MRVSSAPRFATAHVRARSTAWTPPRSYQLPNPKLGQTTIVLVRSAKRFHR